MFRLKFFASKFILRLLGLAFVISITACSVLSINLDDKNLEMPIESSRTVKNFPVEVIVSQRGEDFNISDLKLGKSIQKSISENLYIFNHLDIKKLRVYIYTHDRRQMYNFGLAAPALLPLIEESKLVVSWNADLINGDSKNILEKSIPFKTYTHIIFIPYGLVMSVIRPFTGNWIRPLGFWSNFIDGEGAILSNAIEINKSMLKEYSDSNISKEDSLKKN
jgi:hypothetical protein